MTRAVRHPAALAALATSALVGVGCLDVPNGPAAMCKTTSDCDTEHHEVCEDGVCWGNPPPGPFAAVVSPPITRRDLAPRELAVLAIPDDGRIADEWLALEAPVMLTGRVVAFCPPPMTGCDSNPLGATITVSRRTQFAGGPGFKTVTTVDATADSFSIPVPKTRSGEEPYTVTVVPSGVQPPGGSRAPAEQVPPLRLSMPLAKTTATNVTLGGAGLPTIAGVLTSSVGDGLANYRVSAFGRWDASEPATEVSSVAITDAKGAYSITLSDNLTGTVELIARPRPDGDGDDAAATLHRTNIDAKQSSNQSITAPVNLGNPIEVDIAVTGADLSGTIAAVPGAVVTVSGAVISSGTALAGSDSFTIIDQQITDAKGAVKLHLLDGPGLVASYRLSIVPPASSTVGVVFDQSFSLEAAGPGSPVTLIRRLPTRFALRGQVLDSSGNPLNHASVTARPSLRFLWTLEPAPQAFVAAIPTSSAVTPDTGEFLLWVDATVDQIWGDYELVVEPAAASQAPNFVQTGIAIPRDAATLSTSILPINLPDAAHIHGRITGPMGLTVDNAELKLYALSSSAATSLCTEVDHAPLSCPIPAQLRGRNTSDAQGEVRLALPR